MLCHLEITSRTNLITQIRFRGLPLLIEMNNLLDFLPSALVPFSNLLIEGNADENNSKNTQHVVLSIAQVQQYSTQD